MVERQIEGQNDDEILQIRYPLNDDETRDLIKQKSNNLNSRSRRNPCFKISKNLYPNIGETMKNPISKMKLPL